MQVSRLIIKGSEKDAVEIAHALGRHGLKAIHNMYWSSDSHCVVHVEWKDQIVAWFCEPALCHAERGFPVGTLLHYTII